MPEQLYLQSSDKDRHGQDSYTETRLPLSSEQSDAHITWSMEQFENPVLKAINHFLQYLTGQFSWLWKLLLNDKPMCLSAFPSIQGEDLHVSSLETVGTFAGRLKKQEKVAVHEDRS